MQSREGAGAATAAPRVLHILEELCPSGAEVMLRIAAPYWFGGGSSQAILATGRAEGPYAGCLRAAGFEIFHIPFRKRVRFFYEVCTLMRRCRFDVVHIHTEQAHVFYGLVARIAGTRTIVQTIHSVFPYTGLLRLVRIAMRQGLRLLGATPVAVGTSVADNEKQVLCNRTIVIPNWYDTDVFRSPSREEKAAARLLYGIEDSRPVIATMGNCTRSKSHPLVLETLKVLLERRHDWFYLHAGREDMSKPERSLAAKLGVTDRCSFLGLVNDPRSVLWAADIFVMPSILEGFSIAAIEAAACGLPLVLSDAPGLRDLKTTMPDGFWVRREPAAIADAIEAAHLRFPSGSPSNASSALKWFGAEASARAYFDLYSGARPLRQRGIADLVAGPASRARPE
jgi:glycosyltransferase involved in cell wall biosynthesis